MLLATPIAEAQPAGIDGGWCLPGGDRRPMILSGNEFMTGTGERFDGARNDGRRFSIDYDSPRSRERVRIDAELKRDDLAHFRINLQASKKLHAIDYVRCDDLGLLSPNALYRSFDALVGGAISVPQLTDRFVQGVGSHCGRVGNAQSVAAVQQSTGRWRERHAELLPEADALRERTRESFLRSGREAQWRQVYEDGVPAMTDSLVRAYTTVIDALPNAEDRPHACARFAEQLDEGRHDLARRDPQVARLLKSRLAGRSR